ncbi:E3 ubiquitin-protein ligase RNF34-like [Takifugu flavidus]|uniref:E3 ubiquitin-protein ligase RNF34-like n=1 Tax=Takifugu flavidus TaxID=433684 RepID=UPI0025449710|nr:E3 ubiquitin-protein ligase RNF34-like [Takifugu flavidus]
MKTGASSMWASCCALMSEVMGTGAVRGPQPAFGAAAGLFRFAPGAGYSTYPPAGSGGSGLVCKACGQLFSVFRRKYVCCDCKRTFCTLCSLLQENLRFCATCHLLKTTAFQRARLMHLRVRDLRQYLLLHSIPIDTCREKEDLVELVLCHQPVEEEQHTDGGSLHSHPSPPPTPSATQSTSELSAFAASQDELLSRSDGAGTSRVSPPAQRRARASLSDVSSIRDIESLSVRHLKEILAKNFVNYSGCCEKWELVERVSRLYRDREKNRTSGGAQGPLPAQDEALCRICMDAVLDCVLLECGHMVTCTRCGQRMKECPICRQHVVRAVHVFKS